MRGKGVYQLIFQLICAYFEALLKRGDGIAYTYHKCLNHIRRLESRDHSALFKYEKTIFAHELFLKNIHRFRNLVSDIQIEGARFGEKEWSSWATLCINL